MARLPNAARLWRDKAEIDYIGPFVKSWAAFNAWYRHETGSHRDREGLEFVKNRVNPVRSLMLPLLRARTLDENHRPVPDEERATEFKLLISELHTCLEGFRIEVMRDEILEQISFRSICLKAGVQLPKNRPYNRHTYTVDKRNGIWISTILRANGTEKIRIEQPAYNEDELIGHADFAAELSFPQQGQLRNLYQECNPRPMKNLVAGTNPPILIGDNEFRCTDIELFAGIIETIYCMRNALLHGELEPEQEALKAYEPAYRIIMKFLECVR